MIPHIDVLDFSCLAETVFSQQKPTPDLFAGKYYNKGCFGLAAHVTAWLVGLQDANKRWRHCWRW